MARAQTPTILLIRRAYAYGGAEIYNYNLAVELQKLGYRPIIATQQRELREHAQAAKVATINPLWPSGVSQAIRPRWLRLIGYLACGAVAWLQYLFYLIRYGVDGLLIQTRDDQIFATAAARMLGRRVIWLDHGDFKRVLRQTGLTHRLYLLALGQAKAAVCVSKQEKELVTALLPAKYRAKFTVIYNGVAKQQFLQPARQFDPSRGVTIGSNARIQWQKGVDYLIEGFAAALPKLPPQSKLVLAAAVDDQYIIDKVHELKIEAHFEHRPYLENSAMPQFLAELDIYVFPSLMEVFPLSILEAMMAARPIIATNVGGIPEQIQDGVSGLLVRPKSASAIAEAIVKLVHNPQSAHQYAQAAQAVAEKNFDSSKIAQYQLVPLLYGKRKK